jgi:hypothetical protein
LHRKLPKDCPLDHPIDLPQSSSKTFVGKFVMSYDHAFSHLERRAARTVGKAKDTLNNKFEIRSTKLETNSNDQKIKCSKQS